MDEVHHVADHGTLSPGDGPLCLAVETATATASVALLRGQAVVEVRRSEPGHHHSDTLLPMIDALLGAASCGLDAIGVFAVSIGPGGFTSLRIGLATLKGLAFGTDTPAVAVSSLEALALGARRASSGASEAVWVPVLDARRGEVYAAAYADSALRGDLGALAPVLPESVYDAAGLARALPGGGRLVGEGAEGVAAALDAGDAGPWSAPAEAPAVPDAVEVGLLGLAGLAAGRGAPVGELVPRYVRRAEAEVTRTAQRFESP